VILDCNRTPHNHHAISQASASSGVALGVDRLIALALGHTSIQASLAFDVLRA